VSAANSVGCSVSQIAKNVVLKGSKPYLVILSGDRRVDLKRASMTAGEKLALMESSEVLEHTGFPVGGVPPFGHLKTIKTWVDRSVTRFGVIYTSGGSDSVLLKIEVSELLRFIKAPIVDISI
ncbi:MAG: YbaK/EbsC family protein, partial [Nitrososphaerota archaeon]